MAGRSPTTHLSRTGQATWNVTFETTTLVTAVYPGQAGMTNYTTLGNLLPLPEWIDGLEGFNCHALFIPTYAAFARVNYVILFYVGQAFLGSATATWDFSSIVPSSPGTVRATETLAGTLSITVPWQETKTISRITDVGRHIPDDRLLYGRDILVGGAYSYSWVVTGGSCGVMSVTGSGNVAANDVWDRFANVGGRFRHTPRLYGNFGTQTCFFGNSIVTDGGVAEYLDLSGTESSGITLNGGIGTASVSVTERLGGADIWSEQPLRVRWEGTVSKLFATDFGAAVELVTPDINGGVTSLPSGVFSGTQAFQEHGWTTGVAFVIPTAVSGNSTYSAGTTPGTIELGLSSIWAAGEKIPSVENAIDLWDDENTWFRGLTVKQDGSITVENGDSVSGWTANNGTISSSGGSIKLESGAAAGTTVYAETTAWGKDFRTYRYLRVEDMRGSPARTIRAHFGTKYYDFDAGTAVGTVSIDLCTPEGFETGSLPDTDNTPSSFSTPGAYYGVGTVSRFRLTILNSQVNDVLEIGNMALYAGTIKGIVLPQQAPVMLPYGDVNDWYWRGSDGARWGIQAFALADKKQGIQIPHSKRTGGQDAPNYVVDGERLSLFEAGSILTNYTGMATASPGSATPGSVYNGSVYAGYLRPERMAITSGRELTTYYDTDWGSVDLWAVPSYFSGISLYPGIVNVGTTTGTVFPIRFHKRVYGAEHGLVIDGTAASVGATVTITGSTSPTDTEVSDDVGYFRGTARRIGSTKVETESASLTQNLTTRHYRWNGLAGTASPTGDWVSYDVSLAGRHIRVTSQSGTLITEGATSNPPYLWEVRGTPLTGGTHPCIRFDKYSVQQKLWFAYEQGAAIITGYTEDEGVTFSTVQTIVNGGTPTYPTFTITPNGLMYNYWRTEGSAIKGCVTDLFGGTIVPTFTAVGSAVDNTAIDCGNYVLSGGEQYFTLLYRSGTALYTVISTDGTAFS